MYTLILLIHIIACVGLVLIVLIQPGKGSGIAGLFGGGGSDQLFGASTGMVFVKKVTVVFAVVFICTSLILTVLSSRIGLSTVTGQLPSVPVNVPAPQGQ